MKISVLGLAFLSFVLVGCNQTTPPTVETPPTQVNNQVNLETEVEATQRPVESNQEDSSTETSEVDDTTDLFGAESEIEVSL